MPADSEGLSLEQILAAQLGLAADIQRKVRDEVGVLEAREYKDLISAASGIVTTAYRTDEALRTIETYKLFSETVMEFLRSRSDSIGEDLVEQLRQVSHNLKSSSAVDKVINST